MSSRAWWNAAAAVLALVTPLLSFGQAEGQPASSEPMTAPFNWAMYGWAIAVIVALAILSWGFRGLYMRRRGPHGPRSPTPRAP